MLKELRTQHRNIIQMSFNGFKNNEIAEKTGMTASTISQVLRSPLGKAYMDGLHDRVQESTLDVRKKLIGMNKDALAAFERILNPNEKAPHSVQYNTARDILDRNGYKAPDKLSVDMNIQNKSDEEIDKEIAAMEAAIARTQNIPKETVEDATSDAMSKKQLSKIDPPLADSLPEDFDPFNNIEKV